MFDITHCLADATGWGNISQSCQCSVGSDVAVFVDIVPEVVSEHNIVDSASDSTLSGCVDVGCVDVGCSEGIASSIVVGSSSRTEGFVMMNSVMNPVVAVVVDHSIVAVIVGAVTDQSSSMNHPRQTQK
jgi:hypothetical protein